MAVPADNLRQRIADLFSRDIDQPIEDDVFDALARDVFAFQFEYCAAYRAYCTRRGITPAQVTHWFEIPAVPTAAFKELPLVAGDPDDAELVFQTSGTTAGAERRGTHYVLDANLYRGSLLPTFRAFVLPDIPEMRMLSMVLPATQAPRSSLSYMVQTVIDAMGAPGSAYFIDDERGIDVPALTRALESAIDANEPVCILATSLAMVHLLEAFREERRSLRLPRGSRIMDTGGYKGRTRTIPAEELRGLYSDMLGIAPDHCVNEYGMTEMLSQFYDAALRDRFHGRDAGDVPVKRGPPWTRSRAVDPETLEAVPPGATGILHHFDLANLFSISALQTEDLGRVHPDGIELLGRRPGAAPRGCSIAMDILLERSHE